MIKTRIDMFGNEYQVIVTPPTQVELDRLNAALDYFHAYTQGRMNLSHYRVEFIEWMDTTGRESFLATLGF